MNEPIEGANFPISSTATITINGYTPGTVPTDASGSFTFLLNTDKADEGAYILTAEVNPGASVRFVLDASKFMRSQEGSGILFNLPAGLIPHLVYLPFILK